MGRCEDARTEAQLAFDATEAPTGDQLLQRMEECTTQNMGSCMHQLFAVIREHTGAQARQPSKLMQVYDIREHTSADDDDKEGVIVRGPAVKHEVHKVATHTVSMPNVWCKWTRLRRCSHGYMSSQWKHRTPSRSLTAYAHVSNSGMPSGTSSLQKGWGWTGLMDTHSSGCRTPCLTNTTSSCVTSYSTATSHM